MTKRNNLHLVWVLAKTDFKLRYQGSVLGFVWALLKPLLLFVILNLVFSHLFAGEVEHYALRLLTAILMWNFFAEGTTVGLTSMMSKSHILTKINFPRWIVVVAASLQSLMTFVINLVILLGALLIFGVSLSLFQLVVFVGYLVILYLLVLGFSLFAAPLFIRFRDFNQIWEVLLMAGFYAAPVIYPLTIIPESIRPWLYLNPMTFLIQHAKGILFLGEVSNLQNHLVYLLLLLILLMSGTVFFKFYEKKVIEYL